jgi:hypothetical protein
MQTATGCRWWHGVGTRLALLGLQEVGDTFPDELWLVEAHDASCLGEDLDLAVRDVPGALRCGGCAADEPVLLAEDDEGGRL